MVSEIANQEQEQEENLFAELKDFRDNWSDKVPKKTLQGGRGDKSPKFKVRKNWWQVVTGDIFILADEGKLPEDVKDDALIFYKKFTDEEARKKPTTKKDIAEANALIDKILESQK